MKKAVFFSIVLSLGLPGIGQANPESWVPQPNFRIEDGDYRQTLIFIAGMSYAFTASHEALKSQSKPSFICAPEPPVIGSRLLIDILNAKLSGSVTSETAVATAMQGLRERFPCK